MQHTRPTLAALRYRLADLRDEELSLQYSDAPVWTNGTMRRVRNEIIDVEAEIARRLATTGEAA